MQSITNESRVVAAKEQVSCDLEGEAAVLNLATGVYYGLDKVGATIWQHLQTPTPVSAIHDAVVSRYAVDPERAQSDLLAFLANMMNEGLVELLPNEASIS